MLSTKMKEKLAKDNGESLAEVLVSVLIIAVGLVLLSSLIVASSRMVKTSNDKMSGVYTDQNTVESQSNTISGKSINITSSTATMSTDVNVTIYSSNDSKLMSYVYIKK